jgi:hypothetical protein
MQSIVINWGNRELLPSGFYLWDDAQERLLSFANEVGFSGEIEVDVRTKEDVLMELTSYDRVTADDKVWIWKTEVIAGEYKIGRRVFDVIAWECSKDWENGVKDGWIWRQGTGWEIERGNYLEVVKEMDKREERFEGDRGDTQSVFQLEVLEGKIERVKADVSFDNDILLITATAEQNREGKVRMYISIFREIDPYDSEEEMDEEGQ